MLFGENPKSDVLLACLGLTRGDCGRYRDCYLEGETIVIHTRNGGGNREDYQDVFDELEEHPCYVSDADDDYDCTYANIVFRFPDEYAEDLKALAAESPDVKPSEKWVQLIDGLRAQAKQPPSS